MDKYYNDKGLFRFSIIAPLINNTHGFKSKNEYIAFACQQKYQFKGKEYQFSRSCIKKWYLSYKKEGLKALSEKERKDKAISRKMNNEAMNRIQELRVMFPKITGTAIYQKLIEEDYINKTKVSLNTVLRYVRNNHLKANYKGENMRRMFEMEHVNDCWQADTTQGPYITIEKKKYKTYIIMFIDDKSRMIMGYDIFFKDNAINMQSVFKKAIKTYGKPKRLFVDNGGPYDNKQLALICASLGIELIHAKPYTPEAKAKQERLFRTIKDGWMRCTDWNEFKSIEDEIKSLNEFLYKKYIHKEHSVLKQSPSDRWHEEYDQVEFLEEEKIEESFLHRTSKKVRLDQVISFNNEYYEVPYKYVGQVIEIRYDPLNLKELYIYEKERKIMSIEKVDKVANSKIKRKEGIDYARIVNDERLVEEKE